MGIGVLTSFLVLAEAMFGDGMGATLDIGKTASSSLMNIQAEKKCSLIMF